MTEDKRACKIACCLSLSQIERYEEKITKMLKEGYHETENY